MKKTEGKVKSILFRTGKTLVLLAVGYMLHIAAVEAVGYRLYNKFGDCLINDQLPVAVCEMMIDAQITTFDKAVLYMPQIGKKVLQARMQKIIDQMQQAGQK